MDLNKKMVCIDCQLSDQLVSVLDMHGAYLQSH